MLAAGMPLVDAIEFLREDEDPRWAEVQAGLLDSLHRGHTLSAALRRQPSVFPDYYAGSVASAEMSGQLASTLGFLEEWLDREAELQARLKKALTYPSLVLFLSLVLVLVLFSTVIPKLMTSFETSKTGISWPTEILLLLTKVLSSPLFYLLLTISFGVFVWAWRQPILRSQLIEALYHTPVLGSLLSRAAALRYASTLVLLLESGGQFLPTLRAAAESSASPLLMADSTRMVRGVSFGEPLSELWAERTDYYPRIMAQMAEVGESASSLSGALKSCIPYLEMDIHTRLDNFLEMAEPLLLSGIALFVGFVAIAVILPISEMTAQL